MARVLYDGLVEYEDGTPATTSQMAKDVTTFLAWASEPEHDQRKLMGMQAVSVLAAMLALSIVIKKQKFAPLKSRKIVCECFCLPHTAPRPSCGGGLSYVHLLCTESDPLPRPSQRRQPTRLEALNVSDMVVLLGRIRA